MNDILLMDLYNTNNDDNVLLKKYSDKEKYLSLVECKEILNINMHSLEATPFDNNCLVDANEGLWSITKNILAGIVNVFIRILNTLKTDIFKFYKDLKRTELRFWIESHKVTAVRINNLNYYEIQEIPIPFPNGMNTTYLDAIDKTTKTLYSLDTATKASLAADMTAKIYTLLKSGLELNYTIDSGITSMNVNNIKSIFNISNKCMDNKKRDKNMTKPFSTLFTAMSEFTKSVDMSLDAEKQVNQTSFIYNKMSECNDTFSDIIDYIKTSNGSNVTKNEILKLSKLAFNIAEIFDMFGITVFSYHKLEHNLVEVYKELYRKCLK